MKQGRRTEGARILTRRGSQRNILVIAPLIVVAASRVCHWSACRIPRLLSRFTRLSSVQWPFELRLVEYYWAHVTISEYYCGAQ